MKTIAIEKTDLSSCVDKAQSGRIVVTRNGAPVALVVGVAGLDREQLELGASDKFWDLIRSRRGEQTISRAKLESRVRQKISKLKKS